MPTWLWAKFKSRCGTKDSERLKSNWTVCSCSNLYSDCQLYQGILLIKLAWCSCSNRPINSNYILLPLMTAGPICNIMTEYLMTILGGFCEQIFSNATAAAYVIWSTLFNLLSQKYWKLIMQIKSRFTNSRAFRDFSRLVKDKYWEGGAQIRLDLYLILPKNGSPGSSDSANFFLDFTPNFRLITRNPFSMHCVETVLPIFC